MLIKAIVREMDATGWATGRLVGTGQEVRGQVMALAAVATHVRTGDSHQRAVQSMFLDMGQRGSQGEA